MEESGKKLKSLADEAKEEMDRAAELAKLRGDLAFDSALADINREADKFERKLKKSREEMEMKRREFREWEKDVAESRSAGQFFKNLYTSRETTEEDEDQEKGGGLGSGMMSKSDIRQRAEKVVDPAIEETRSPARLYIFSLLGAVLVIDIVLDATSPSPSVGLDGLYGVLAALAAWLAINEQKALRKDGE